MGASNFTHVEATWTQRLGDWIGAHTRALSAIGPIGGAPRLFVPDNAKVVIKACLYEPQVNRTHAEMAAHYGAAVLPAKPRRPRDKAKVEALCLSSSAGSSAACAIAALQPRRAERGDRRAGQAAQRGVADPPARGDPPATARGVRSAGAQAAADRALCLRRMARAPGLGIDYHVEVDEAFLEIRGLNEAAIAAGW